MNILKRLTIKDLKLNKKRTIGTLIGIILAITLITVVGGMFFSMRKTLIESEIQSNGYYHVQLSDISESEVNNVKNNKDFSHIETMYDLGNAVITLENDRFQQLHTYSMSKETADYLKYNITEGRFPENEKQTSGGFEKIKAKIKNVKEIKIIIILCWQEIILYLLWILKNVNIGRSTKQ